MAKYIISDIFEGDYPVTQKYANDPQEYGKFGLKGHEGVDWGTPVGVWVIVPFEKGQILRNGYDPIYGYYIVIWDAIQKCAVWYCHLSSINCTPGQVLARGTRVGKTGATGNVNGAHLHCNFCETDQYANRLNTKNGYLGFLNILDPNLVEWKLVGNTPSLSDTELIKAIKDKINTSITDTDFRNWTRKLLGV